MHPGSGSVCEGTHRQLIKDRYGQRAELGPTPASRWEAGVDNRRSEHARGVKYFSDRELG